MLFYPIIAVICETTGYLVDKYNYKTTQISVHFLMRLIFLTMGVSLLLYVVVAGIPLLAFSVVAMLLLVLLAIVSFFGNFFDYLSLRNNDLSLRQPILGMEPILASFLGQIFFADERKDIFLIAILLSCAVMYIGYRNTRVSLEQKKGMQYLLIAVAIYAFGPSIYKITLPYISPEYITLFRVLFILILSSVLLPVKRGESKNRNNKIVLGIGAGILYAAGAVASLYAIDAYGVTQTMLLLALTPAIVYLSAHFFFKERVLGRCLLSSACLIAIILGTTFIQVL